MKCVEIEGLFNTYKSTFTSLQKQKNISESDLDKIYSSLTSSVGILKSKGVCKLSDISKLTEREKSTVMSNLSYGAQYAKLSVPSVNIQSNVYFGDTNSILSIGVGHTTSSDMPTEDNVIIYSSHNRENLLKNLKDIQINEKIVVDTDYAKCTYVVKKIQILKDTETDKLNKIEDKETLILYTCYPFDTYIYSDERYVVFATLQETIWK